MLGYNYGITGRISHGQKIGTTLGVPTINILWPEKKLVPPKGVYLARVHVDGKWYNGVANVGTRPTVTNDNRVFFECFLLRFEGNIYGKKARAELIDFLRPEEKFNSIEELKAQLKKDIIAAKTYFECSKNK
ncbi:MAG: riboflavin kinase, partial [Dorea sp.]